VPGDSKRDRDDEPELDDKKRVRVLRPLVDGEMSRFMGWIGGTHTMRCHI